MPRFCILKVSKPRDLVANPTEEIIFYGRDSQESESPREAPQDHRKKSKSSWNRKAGNALPRGNREARPGLLGAARLPGWIRGAGLARAEQELLKMAS